MSCIYYQKEEFFTTKSTDIYVSTISKTFRLELRNRINHAFFRTFQFYFRVEHQNIVTRDKSLHGSMNKQKELR